MSGFCHGEFLSRRIHEANHLTRRFRFSIRSLLFVVVFFAVVLTSVVWYERTKAPYRLIEAAYQGDVSTVQRMLSQGTNVHARDGWNSTALMYASSWGHLEIVKELLKAGAPINERARGNNTPLMFAAEAGHLAIVEYFIDQGADTRLVNDDGKSAAELAADGGFIAVESLIQSASANSSN